MNQQREEGTEVARRALTGENKTNRGDILPGWSALLHGAFIMGDMGRL